MGNEDKKNGIIKQIIGAVVDVYFEENLPEVYTALEVESSDGKKVVLEVQQHLGFNIVRTISMGTTDGLKRGDLVVNTNKGITVPVGKETLGRIFNVLGEAVDGEADLVDAKRYEIHRSAPDFVDQS